MQCWHECNNKWQDTSSWRQPHRYLALLSHNTNILKLKECMATKSDAIMHSLTCTFGNSAPEWSNCDMRNPSFKLLLNGPWCGGSPAAEAMSGGWSQLGGCGGWVVSENGGGRPHSGYKRGKRITVGTDAKLDAMEYKDSTRWILQVLKGTVIFGLNPAVDT